ncbi:glycosyltransferase family 1 protein [Paraburkholderia sp. J67]|uniref:glycosyltransferase family 4 protein n=1 Tax=Paraburkholderia sp. J67 TaxID=2805435 RepID=UPI002ABD9CF3|nr:glycosyltransferase family 1 protein [Paraburkholderia sp. J67]
MKVALAIDALAPPLTGIGRYTWELAQRMYCSTQFDDVCFYANGISYKDPSSKLNEGKHSARLLPGRAISNWWGRKQARACMRSHLFHSPNYLLPKGVESGVITVHDLSVFRFAQSHPKARVEQFEQQFNSTLARSRHIITDSEAIRSEVASYFNWPIERITSVPLGVSPTFRQHDAAELLPALASLSLRAGHYALCISTLEPRKRIDRLIDAYAALPAPLRYQFPLVIAGASGWLSEGIMARIHALSPQGWIRYIGFVDEARLPALYAGARAFFFPSIYEGFGLPAIEAMASGVPTLTTGNSVMSEVCDDAAWLTNPDDHDALRNDIERVLTDDEWRARAVKKGFARAALYHWDTCFARTLDVYRSIQDNPTTPGYGSLALNTATHDIVQR